MQTIIIPLFISRSFIQSHLNWSFIYGTDYLLRSNQGQSNVCKFEPNTYPVPTCLKPCMFNDHKFFNDDLFNMYKSLIDERIEQIPRDKIIVPFRKIGEGCSEMKTKAPRLYTYLMEQIQHIKNAEISIDYAGTVYPLYGTT